MSMLPTKRLTAPKARWDERLVRTRHLEHGVFANLEVVALAARTHDGARQRGLIHTVPDHGLVDVSGHHFAKREPGIGLLAVGALELNDLCQLAFERDRAFGD